MTDWQFKVDERLRKQLKLRFERHEFQVGVLENRPYRKPLSKRKGLGSLEGGPVRKKSRRLQGTLADVSEEARKRVDFYKKPFARKQSADIRAFIKAFFQATAGKAPMSRPVAALRAVIRNPILRQAYGRNSGATARVKGFSRFLIDTGQLFRAIAARVRSKRVS